MSKETEKVKNSLESVGDQKHKDRQITTADITVDPAIEALFPRLSDSQYQALKASILDEGQRMPIYVNERGVVCDGHHRLRACHELKIPPKFEIIHFTDKLEERQFLTTVNLFRRNLTRFQIIELTLEGARIEIKLAKRRQLEHLRRGRSDIHSSPAAENMRSSSSPLVEISTNEGTSKTRGRVNKILAGRAGVSPSTFARGKYIVEHGSDGMKTELRQGRTSIDAMYKQLKPKKAKRYLQTDGKHWNDEESLVLRASPVELAIRADAKNRELSEYPIQDCVDFAFASYPFLNSDIPIPTLYAHAVELSEMCLRPGKYFAIYTDTRLIGDTISMITNKHTLLQFVDIFATERLDVESDDSHIVHIVDAVLLFRKRLTAGTNLPAAIEGTGSLDNLIKAEASHHPGFWGADMRMHAEVLIRTFTKMGDIVLDPAAVNPVVKKIAVALGRRFIATILDLDQLEKRKSFVAPA